MPWIVQPDHAAVMIYRAWRISSNSSDSNALASTPAGSRLTSRGRQSINLDE